MGLSERMATAHQVSSGTLSFYMKGLKKQRLLVDLCL